jgi:dipeptidyl aminopeptidase/acylaminoacyl peptidase
VWSPDSKKIYFQRMSRDWLKLDLCCADPASGESRILIEEQGFRQYYYEIRPPLRILGSTGEFVWWSWSEGWGQYYLYSADGDLRTRITDGSFNSGRIVYCDEGNRVLYFMGNAGEKDRNPYNHYLYRINLDGSDMTLLTPEDAEHEIYMCNSGTYFVDSYSRPDLKPHAVVRDNLGDLVMELEASDISELVDAGWQKPDIFKAVAADDSTELWGVMYKPFDFDPGKKYPTIVYGYPGKETEFVPLKFYNNNWITVVSTALAQYGFIVTIFGNRGGTIERSYDYYNYGWDNLRDYPIADKKYVMQQLAGRHEWIDIDRIGVMGSSSGGFFAAAAILAEPDFFKVAVAKSGNHDNNVYYHHWNERYGEVAELIDEKGQVTFESKTPSNNEIAGNLKGRLLLVQGDVDHYVPPSLTSRFANSLIEANKRFDQFIVPGGDHFFGKNWQYLIRYIELYFVGGR